MPEATIIIPTFNMSAFIRRAIDNARHQGAAKLVVVDDGSTDETPSILSEYGDVHTFVQENAGASVARNHGLATVTTKYTLFHDADDYQEGPLVEGMIAAAEASGAEMVFAPWCWEWPCGRRSPGSEMVHNAASNEDALCAFLGGAFVVPIAILWRTDFVRSIGGWNEKLLTDQDGELVRRAFLRGGKRARSQDGCAVYFQHESSTRMRNQVHEEKICSGVTSLDLTRDLAGPGASRPVKHALAKCYYNWARACHNWGHHDLAELFRGRARGMGLRGHPGPIGHRLAASVLGLRGKEALRAAVLRRATTVSR